jgi:protein TonB
MAAPATLGAGVVDSGVVWRLLAALAASAAIHLSLLYTVRPAPPAPEPPAAVLRARLQASAAPVARDARVTDRSESHVQPVRRQAPDPSSEHEAAQPVTATAVMPQADVPATPDVLPPVVAPIAVDTTWYPARLLDVFPRPVATPQPAYPEHAGMERMGGEVTLLMLIDETGTVHELSVVEAQPAGAFEAAAVAAYQGVRFEPARKDGRAVRSRVLVRVAFSPD